MNDLSDDILSDLAELESSTTKLASSKEDAKQKQQTLKNLDPAKTIDAASISLEAAKAAQEAATQSQLAAESAIKLSQEFKAQIIELTDSNASWRQTTRVASHEISASRSAVTVMMSVTIALGVITTGLSAWFMYYTTKKQAMFKGEVLDLIQTENTLFNKGITLKVDQISSLIEAFSADFQAMSQNNTAASHALAMDQSKNLAPVNTYPDENRMDAHDQPTETMPPQDLGHGNPAQDMAHNNTPATEAPHEAPNNMQAIPPSHATSNLGSDGHLPPPTMNNHDFAPQQQYPAAMPAPYDMGMTMQQYAELKSMVELIIDKQQTLQASIMAQGQLLQKPNVDSSAVNHNPVHSTETTSTNEQQVKQLEGLSWLIRKQEKTLKEIQSMLKGQGSESHANSDTAILGIEKSLNELKAQITSLSTQQKAIEAQVTDLQVQTKKLSEAPKPYSYQNR